MFPGALAGRVSDVVGKGIDAVEKGIDHALAATHAHAVIGYTVPANKRTDADKQADRDIEVLLVDKKDAGPTPPAPAPAPPLRVTSERIAGDAARTVTRRSGSDPAASATPPDEDDDEGTIDENNNNGVIFHKNKDYKFGAVYWRHGFSLPENGSMKLRGRALILKGIVGTRLTFDLNDVEVEKASRMAGFVHDAFIVRSKKKADTVAETEEDGEFYFSTVLKNRKKVLNKIQLAMADKELRSKQGQATDKVKYATKKKKFRLLPDETLQKMNIIGEKMLKGVSLQDYYEVAWSEGHGCDKEAMYGPFLQQQGKNDVTVGPWEAGAYVGDWCGEAYAEERIVTFSFMKKTIGQTLVEVRHTQRRRRVSNDRCIVQIKMEMKGFPYADCFVVEVRHVASRVGDNDLTIQIGMFVKFLKSCMFENKIRTNTGAETAKAQLTLLEMISEGCASHAKEAETSANESDEEGEEEETLNVLTVGVSEEVVRSSFKLPEPLCRALQFIVMAFATIFRAYVRPYVQPEMFDIPPSTVEEALRIARTRMKSLEELSLKSVSERQGKHVSREVASIEESMNRIEKMTIESHVS